MIYTIGYTSFDLANFIEVLNYYGINCIIDVRSLPYSQYYSMYNKDKLQSVLKNQNILYRNYVKEFGARQTNAKYLGDNGQVDFCKFRTSEIFKSGVEKVKRGMELNYKFCLMCAETDPLTCHRSILLSKGIQDEGIAIKHILKDKSLETHAELEERLIQMYFPSNNQLSLFDTHHSQAELLEQSYVLQNKNIGYYAE